MALTELTYGYVNSGASEGYAVVTDGYARAYTYRTVSEHMWVTDFHGRVGYSGTGSQPTFRFGAWLASGTIPGTRVGYSSERTASTAMDSGSTGALFENVGVVIGDLSPANTGIQFWSGSRYSLGLQSDTANAYVAMIFAASISETEERFFETTGSAAGTTPPAPFGAYNSVTAGHMTVWVSGYANEAPRVPVDRTPSGTIDTTTPTFTSTFRDRNGDWGTANDGYDSGDEIQRYRIQVRRVSDGTIMWAPAAFSATSTEKTTESTSKVYAGSALSRGVAYEWRIQHQDMFDAWGDWSTWLEFTPANKGYIFTNASSPTGKQEVITGITFGGSWTHQDSLSTNAVEIRLKENGTVVQTSATITKTVLSAVSPGTAFTLSWADTGFTDLSWGHSYTYEIRGRDTSNNWSDWSDGRAFNINAAPSIPSSLSPNNGAVQSSYPLLKCIASDADSDDDESDLTVKAIITRPNATTTTVTLPYNASTGYYEYQTTGTEISATGVYSWVAYSYDGTIYSGEESAEVDAVTSSSVTFEYADGPDVTVVTPTEAEVFETVTPTFEWSVSGGTQAKYRIYIYAAADDSLVYDSTQITGTETTFEIPLGNLDNETSYYTQIEVEDTTPLIGTSTVVNFEVDYPPVPELTNFQATPVLIGTDSVESAIRLTWDASIEPAPWFVRYILRRSDLSRPLAYISSQSQTEYIDYLPVSGVTYEYTIRQVNVIDGINVASPTVSAEASVSLEGVVLCDVAEPSLHRAVLSFGETRKHTRTNNNKRYLPWNATAPTTVRGLVRYWTTAAKYHLISDSRIGVTALQRLDELEDLIENGAILCYRDERGRKRFVMIQEDGYGVEDVFPQRADVTLTLVEEAYDEGESD